MNIIEILKQLISDLQIWVTNNLNFLNTKIDNKADVDNVLFKTQQSLTNTEQEQIRDNLGVSPAYSSGTINLEDGISHLAAGTVYFVFQEE